MHVQPYSQPYSQPPSCSESQSAVFAGMQSQPMVVPPPQPSLFQDGSAPVFRACASAMQRPTLMNVRIRSTRDANQIFHTVLRNLLPMTVRRLDAEERRAITSGNVYVWEERGATSEATGLGIERWTDGMRWSPSRVRDEFLFYHQKEMDPEEAADLPPTRWARIVRPKTTGSDGSSSDASPDKIPHQRPLNDPEKLIKQTYSVHVALPEDAQRGVLRKWHLTAYFTQATVDKLLTVDEVLPGPRAVIPDGLFRSARAGKTRRDTGPSRQQHQQRPISFAQSYASDAAGPSGTTPISAYPPSTSIPPSATFSPQTPLYGHISPQTRPPHYPYAQYSAYIQDEAARSPPLPYTALDAPNMPPGGSYTSTPAPPPQTQTAVYDQGHGLRMSHARTPRDPGYEREAESKQQVRRERERISPPKMPHALPNTYDPALQRVVVPVHPRSPSYSHPYASALSTHLAARSVSVGVPGPSSDTGAGSVPHPLVSQYYSPAKPIEPIEVSIARHAASSRGAYMHGKEEQVTADKDKVDYESPVQRDSEIGPARRLSSPLSRRNSLHLPVAPSTSPRPVPTSASCPPTGLGSGLGPSAVPGNARQATPRPSPVSGILGLEEGRTRLLVPLDSLENAVHPRRDPTDDALLRRFNALRTTQLASTARDE